MGSADIFLGMIAILFPPLPVWVKRGICSGDSLINILLCVLGFIPGLLHAWYIIAKFPDANDSEYETLPQDREGGGGGGHRVQGQQPPRQSQPRLQGEPRGYVNYGTQGGAAGSSGQEQGVTGADEGGVPPAYTDVVGDHKVQSRN